MPANKWALLRYHIIDGKLNKRFPNYPTKEDLRQACEDELYGTMGENISISTIEKDIHAMKYEEHLGFFAPIEYNREYGGYHYTREYTLADIPLTEVDMEALYFASNILSQFSDLKVLRQFKDAVNKISDVVRISCAIGQDVDASAFIQFEKAPYLKGSELLTDLAVAIKEKKVVNLMHKGFSRDEASDHIVHPYLLKEFRNRWYVIGWQESVGQIRTFGLERIERLEAVAGVDFRENTEFDPEAFFRHVYGISEPDGKPVKIVLSFTPLQGKYILTKPLHETQEVIKNTEEKLVVSCNVVPNYEFLQRILSYGDQVKVLEPKMMVQKVKAMVKSMMKVYG